MRKLAQALLECASLAMVLLEDIAKNYAGLFAAALCADSYPQMLMSDSSWFH